MSLDLAEGSEDYSLAGTFAGHLAGRVLEKGLPADTLLNVNVPDVPANQLRGVEITRAGKRIYYDQLIKRSDPNGRPYYWIGGERPGGDRELEGTDIWALANNRISITPIHMDMTNHALIKEMSDWLSGLSSQSS
jgi:5'-nucleotidase